MREGGRRPRAKEIKHMSAESMGLVFIVFP